MTRRVVAVGVALCALGFGSAPSVGADERPHLPVPEPLPAAAAVTAGPPGFTYTYRAQGPSGAAATPADGVDEPVLRADARGSTSQTSATATSSGPFVPPPNDDFVFDFAGTEPSQEAVFHAAGGIWSAVLEVEVPIEVRVTTVSFPDANILGGAEPTDLHANEVRFPATDVWFVSAQANQFAGRDLDPDQPEIDIVISSDIDFHEGIDDDVPPDQVSLLNLALHELAHGLGHITLARPVGTSWSITWPTPHGRELPLGYDRLLVDGARTPLTMLPADALGTALRSRVLWNGAEGIAADGDVLPELYAPHSFQPGSSTSHLDERTYPEAMMTPNIANGEAHLEIPPLTQAMFADFGWGLEVSGDQETFITALTRDFIHRFPTPTQLDLLVGALRNGTPRRDVVAMYANSDAYLGRLLDRYYLSTLGRPGDEGGKQHWLRELRSGRTPASVASSFYASSEYFEKAGNTDRSWLTDLYAEILGRPPDEGGLAAWEAKARSGADRTAIAFAFYQSRESRGKRVTDLYNALLGRAPDPAGLDHWRQILHNGHDVHLAIDLARSSEYGRRAVTRYG